ncbi:MAG: acetyl-CoA carboxylase biotin carboxylase subunit [Magnetospiraceae bacterium]
MFKKILIANRGEIACRVIKSARKMGILTVAVHSEADRDALHVKMADEAVHIGPSPSAESYLVIDKIIDACKQTGAEAVHPGYGFLSENAEFQSALKKNNIAFIGPETRAIQAMGDKIESKKLAQSANVNVVPGHVGVIKDTEEAVKIAEEIGYPVMIKASAGGGGKGMRVAWNAEEAADGFERSTSEARSSFGDDRVFIEKFIEEPRHIEIQILSDGDNTIYLGERECSIQRRHQKVIEEAPSPFMDLATRTAMGEQAVALAKAVDYVSAGTVEFIVDKNKNFFFLEMNTRLQVEHPVTELITGLDLVEHMIRIAAGEKLEIKQSDVTLKGWAMECRVYAEDPYREFLPSIGRLTHYMPPAENEIVRVDTGVEEGGDISMYYDPMIAKLITYGATREFAMRHMREALDEFYIQGVSHNIPFLASLMSKERFVRGKLSTNFIAEEYPDGFRADDLPPEDPTILLAVAATVHQTNMNRDALISGQMMSEPRRVATDWVVKLNDDYAAVSVSQAEGGFDIVHDGKKIQVRTDWVFGQPLFKGTVDGHRICVQIIRDGIRYRLFHAGAQAEVIVLTHRAAELDGYMLRKEPPDMSRYLLSPMPGLLVSVGVEEGASVKAGENLAVVEAMKMENILKAARDGVVSKIHAQAGASLAVEQIILEFE